MPSEVKTTTLSIISPPQTCSSSEISESTVAGLQHALVIDFRESDSLEFTRASRTYSLFLHHLRSVVRRDGRDNPQFDMVYLFRSLEFPDERLWKVLRGLRPQHLEVHSSWEEECDLEPLEQLRWPLESLTISGATGNGLDVPSKLVQYIPSLTLNYCYGLYFSPATDHSALRHLTIIKNDAIDMFNDLMNKFGVANDLQTLKLQNANYDGYHICMGLAGFSRTLKQCTSLVSLDLAIYERLEAGYSDNEFSNGEPAENEHLEDEGSEADWGEGFGWGPGDEGSKDEGLKDSDSDSEDEDRQAFLDLPQHLPHNVEYLRFSFRGPQKVVDNLSMWLRCASDPLWLPNLKTLSFKLDFGKPPSGHTVDTEPQVEKILSLFLGSRPTVQIIR